MTGVASWAGFLLAAIPALTNLGIATYVLARMRRNAVTYVFALFVLAMTTWQASEACTRTVDTLRQAEACRGFLFAGGLLVAPLGMHFALIFTDRRHLVRSPLLLVLLYGPALLFEALNRAGFNEARLVQNPVWGWQQQPPPPIVSVFSSYWVILLTFGTLIVLMRFAYKLPRDDERKRQAWLVAGGLALPLLVGASLQVVLPTVFQLPSIPLTSASLTLFSLAVVLALRNHQFLATPTIEDRLEEAQHTMRQQSELLAQAERVADLGSWEWHVQANEVRWSKQLYRIFGVDSSTFQPSFDGYLAQVHPDDREAAQETIKNALESGAPFAFEHRVAGREEVWIGATGRIIETGPDGPVRMAGTAQDITDHKRAQAEERRLRHQQAELDALQTANQFKTTFLNTAAHELATPLTPVKIQIRLLLKKTEKDHPDLHGSLEILSRNLDRLDLLVHDLLDGARLQSDRLRLRFEDVDVADLVRQSIATHAELAKDRRVDILSDLPDRLQVRADRSRIDQVLDNLLGNALKFTREGGHVVARVHKKAARAVVTVEDDGIGFAAEAAGRLFQPFIQLHSAEENLTGGTGLGLYISSGIAEAHGGRLRAHSDGPDQGATFTLEIPLNGPQGPS